MHFHHGTPFRGGGQRIHGQGRQRGGSNSGGIGSRNEAHTASISKDSFSGSNENTGFGFLQDAQDVPDILKFDISFEQSTAVLSLIASSAVHQAAESIDNYCMSTHIHFPHSATSYSSRTPTTSGHEADREKDVHRVSQRQKQIELGKNTIGYDRYRLLVPRTGRGRRDPQTPDATKLWSKKQWDTLIRRWRRTIHCYDIHCDPPSFDPVRDADIRVFSHDHPEEAPAVTVTSQRVDSDSITDTSESPTSEFGVDQASDGTSTDTYLHTLSNGRVVVRDTPIGGAVLLCRLYLGTDIKNVGGRESTLFPPSEAPVDSSVLKFREVLRTLNEPKYKFTNDGNPTGTKMHHNLSSRDSGVKRPRDYFCYEDATLNVTGDSHSPIPIHISDLAGDGAPDATVSHSPDCVRWGIGHTNHSWHENTTEYVAWPSGKMNLSAAEGVIPLIELVSYKNGIGLESYSLPSSKIQRKSTISDRPVNSNSTSDAEDSSGESGASGSDSCLPHRPLPQHLINPLWLAPGPGSLSIVRTSQLPNALIESLQWDSQCKGVESDFATCRVGDDGGLRKETAAKDAESQQWIRQLKDAKQGLHSHAAMGALAMSGSTIWDDYLHEYTSGVPDHCYYYTCTHVSRDSRSRREKEFRARSTYLDSRMSKQERLALSFLPPMLPLPPTAPEGEVHSFLPGSSSPQSNANNALHDRASVQPDNTTAMKGPVFFWIHTHCPSCRILRQRVQAEERAWEALQTIKPTFPPLSRITLSDIINISVGAANKL